MSVLVPVWNVRCVLCGRVAGRIVHGRFLKDAATRAPTAGRAGTSRCGECSGNLYAEPDDPITPMNAAQLVGARLQAVAAAAPPAPSPAPARPVAA